MTLKYEAIRNIDNKKNIVEANKFFRYQTETLSDIPIKMRL